MNNIFKENEYALWYDGSLAIDADGAPNAYGPPGSNALDYLANAGNPGNWYGIITDNNENPIVQKNSDPCPGMYISPTSLQDPNKHIEDPLKYVNSNEIPYLSVAKDILKNNGISLGDIGFAYNKSTKLYNGAIIADAGPRGKYGEGSICLAKAIGIKNTSPKNGGVSSGIICFIFKNSKRNPIWPKTRIEIEEEARQLIDSLDGVQNILKTIGITIF